MQKPGAYIITLLTIGISLLFQSACADRIPPKSELFYSVFLDDSSTFRHTFLGEAMKEVMKHEESARPIHQDAFGLKYELELSPTCRMMIHYLPQSMKSGGAESRRIASIVANVDLNSEVETARLYNEIEDHFNLLYGRENLTGKYGNYTWNCSKNYISSMEVRLSLGNDQKNILMNFVDTQSGQIIDSLESNNLMVNP